MIENIVRYIEEGSAARSGLKAPTRSASHPLAHVSLIAA